MKKTVTTIVVVIIIFIGILIAGPLFIVEEGEQAVVVQMGRLARVITSAGLYFKTPFIDEVVRYPKRIMAWDGEQKSIPTREKQYIWVDVTARWRISDPKKFYESIGSLGGAYSKLSEVIDSEVKTVTAENYFRESVRNSNIIMERDLMDDLGIGDEIDPSVIQSSIRSNDNYEPVEKGRRRIAEEILERSRRMVPEYGIELIDVVTRQISYSDDLTQSVYARMIKERNQIAQAIRSEGEGRKAALLGRMANEQMEIRSVAYNRAETIRGEADAEAARIYADAYNRDRNNFYDFWRAIESYRQTMPQFNKTLTTNMDYFRYLYSPR